MTERKPIKLNIYGLKIFAADVGAKALFNIWANGVTFEPNSTFEIG